MKYVDIDRSTGEAKWDRYFEYIRSMTHRMSDDLYNYASDFRHYSLNDPNTLHDAWLSKIELSVAVPELVIEYVGARHDRRHIFHYRDVASYAFSLDVQYVRGDRDVLVHEFSFDETDFVTHEVLFTKEQRMIIRARSVVPTLSMGI